MVPYTINPPESAVEFENICLAVLKKYWNRPGLERFGKSGEGQFGVDILDTRAEEPLYVAQCKLKEQTKFLPPSEIKEEVKKARTFPTKFDYYAILTTGKISTHGQKAVQLLNQENKAQGSFVIQLFSWDDISKLIRKYPEIEAEFYGGFRSEEVAAFTQKIEYLTSTSEETLTTVRTNAIDIEIDEARASITPREAQLAVLQLNQIKRKRGSQLSDWHRFRIATNLGTASMLLFKGNEAARHFLEAALLRPDDELAVANEAFAYYILGEDEQARQKLEAAKNKFPNSTRIHFLWIQSSPLDRKYEDILAATPVYMRRETEVASALSRRAMAENQFDAAIEHANASVIAKPDWSQAHLLLAQVEFGRVVLADRSPTPLYGDHRVKALSQADSTAEKTTSIASAEGNSHIKALAIGLRSQIAFLLGRKDDGIRFAEEAYTEDPLAIDGQLSFAQALAAMGNPDHAISILHAARSRSNDAPNVNFTLGEALLARGKMEDFASAYEIFKSARFANLKRELIDPIIIGAAKALTLAERYDEIEDYAKRPEVASSIPLSSALKAFAQLKRGALDDSNRLLDEALASIDGKTTLHVIDLMARILMQSHRWKDALPLWQRLFIESGNIDPTPLLNCAGQLRRDDVILDTLDAMHARGIQTWQSIEYEVQYLEKYDNRKAIDRLDEYIAANPDNKVAPLRRAILGMHHGLDELAQISIDGLPSPEDLEPSYATAAVHLLQWTGHCTKAVDYAYRHLRSHLSALESHKGYLASMMPGAGPRDVKPWMDAVEIGSAVQFTTGSSLAPEWVVIEDTDVPCAAFEEVSSKSDLAKALLGKRVGETFLRLKSPIRDHIGTVTQIMPKYVRRSQSLGPHIENTFPEQNSIWTLTMPPPDQMTIADVQPILDSVRTQSNAVMTARDIYKTSSITLHMYGSAFGHTAHEALIDLARILDMPIKCSPSDRTALDTGMAAIATNTTLVVDLVTLATLRILGVTRQLLSTTGYKFVVTAGTRAALQQMRISGRFSTASGRMLYKDGQHYMIETSEVEAQADYKEFEDWMAHVEANTSVLTVPELARLDPAKREQLEEIVGWEGLESAVLALRPGHLLWSDDLLASEVLRTELGCNRVWTQVVTEAFGMAQLIDWPLAHDIYAKLIGYDFQATYFTGTVMLSGLRLSNYSPRLFPARRLIEMFGETTRTDRRISFAILTEILVQLVVEPILPETRCEILKSLFTAYPNDQTSNSQLELFAKHFARSTHALNPDRPAELLQCYDNWRRQRRSRIPIIDV